MSFQCKDGELFVVYEGRCFSYDSMVEALIICCGCTLSSFITDAFKMPLWRLIHLIETRDKLAAQR